MREGTKGKECIVDPTVTLECDSLDRFLSPQTMCTYENMPTNVGKTPDSPTHFDVLQVRWSMTFAKRDNSFHPSLDEMPTISTDSIHQARLWSIGPNEDNPGHRGLTDTVSCLFLA